MFFLDPIEDLNAMLASATDMVSDALGEHTYDDPWRVRGRRRLARLAGRMIADFVNRRDNHGCDTNMRSLAEAEEVDDDIEKSLPEACKDIAKPFQILSRDARQWSETWNNCGTGKNRHMFRERTWKTLRKVRRTAYENMGCYDP